MKTVLVKTSMGKVLLTRQNLQGQVVQHVELTKGMVAALDDVAKARAAALGMPYPGLFAFDFGKWWDDVKDGVSDFWHGLGDVASPCFVAKTNVYYWILVIYLKGAKGSGLITSENKCLALARTSGDLARVLGQSSLIGRISKVVGECACKQVF